MKIIKPLTYSVLIASIACSHTLANETDDRCTIYGKFGGTVAANMLPITVQDLVDGMTGKRPEVLQNLTADLLDSLTGAELIELGNLGDENSELLGEAAGMIAMNALMSGQASSGEEIRQLLTATCEKVGMETILESQRQTRLSTQAMSGETP